MKPTFLLSSLFVISSFFLFSANAQKFEPKWAGTVVALQIEGNDTVSIPTEKANIKVKTAHSAGRLLVGIGNTRQKCIIQGGTSTTQLPANNTVFLIVKCKDNDTDPSSFIQIVKFEQKKKERKAELANVNWLGNVSEGNMDMISYEAESYGKSSYILSFEPQEGEFGVRILNPNEKDEKITIFHCFGIHKDI